MSAKCHFFLKTLFYYLATCDKPYAPSTSPLTFLKDMWSADPTYCIQTKAALGTYSRVQPLPLLSSVRNFRVYPSLCCFASFVIINGDMQARAPIYDISSACP